MSLYVGMVLNMALNQDTRTVLFLCIVQMKYIRNWILFSEKHNMPDTYFLSIGIRN